MPLVPTRRPWKEFLDTSALSPPHSYGESMYRVRRNANYFGRNYALIVLIVLFCSLVYHPLSIVVFLLLFALWLPLLFLRDAPLAVFGTTLSDRALIPLLGLLTVLALVATGLGTLVFAALLLGVLLVGFHAVFRGVEGLFLDENEAAQAGFISVLG